MGSVGDWLNKKTKEQMGRESMSTDSANVMTGKVNAPSTTVMGGRMEWHGKNLFDYMVSNAGKSDATDWKSVQNFADSAIDISKADTGMYTMKLGRETLQLSGPVSNKSQGVPDVRKLKIVGKE